MNLQCCSAKDPIKWRQSAVMTSDWRLINGKELYAIKADPSQKENIANKHPDVVARLTNFYEAWWTELEPTFADATPIYLGHPADNPARLTCHDWITTEMTPWNQSQVLFETASGDVYGAYYAYVTKK